jgi:hypothetical protein
MLSFALLWAVSGTDTSEVDWSVKYACNGCSLGTDIDPGNDCCVDHNGFPSFDADTATGDRIRLDIEPKGNYKDVFSKMHPPTSQCAKTCFDKCFTGVDADGEAYTDKTRPACIAACMTEAQTCFDKALKNDTLVDSRYVLACAQEKDVKTIKMTITRPKELTRFGAEWVKLFEKDSWKNVTSETEPFTFNEYGAKIPIAEDRQPLGKDGRINLLDGTVQESEQLTVFMEVSGKGDFEVMYGTPALKHNNNWVAVRFGKTLLRVGSPWTYCDPDDSGDQALPDTITPSVGAIMPLFFGGPNTASIAIEKKNNVPVDENYETVITELSGTTVPVIVVLDIFNRNGKPSDFKNVDTNKYTDSEATSSRSVVTPYEMCYKAGNACPEKHSVCKKEFCEIDVWRTLITKFKDQGDHIKVFGAVDSEDALKLYQQENLGLDGYFFHKEYLPDAYPESTYKGAQPDTGLVGSKTATSNTDVKEVGNSVHALGRPLFHDEALDDASVYVTLVGEPEELGFWNPYAWYSSTKPSKWAALVLGAESEIYKDGIEGPNPKYFGTAVKTLVDRGYGWVYATDQTGEDAFGKKNGLDMGDLLAAIETPTMARRLAERRLTASAPFWGCDDTLFMCKPICLRQTGVVTTKVANNLCTSAPMDQCACKCYHEAQWTCDGDVVVCKAKEGEGELKTVGDKVCEIRGAPKPASTAELRIASTCEPVTEMRGDAPTSQCLAQWATTTTAPTEAPEPTEAPTEAATSEDGAKVSVPVIQESFAAAMAFLALAVYA